jgi:NDP-sugar pyrophosphorylase family protein
MLLCAGLGVRLKPLTEHIPKPMLPVFGRLTADYALEALAEAGVSDVVVNQHHLPDIVKSSLGTRSRGMNIHYSFEPELLGPTGGIRKALPLLGSEPFFVVNGDALMEIDFTAMMRAHVSNDAALTVAVGPGHDTPDIRAVGVAPDNRVRSLWGIPLRPGESLSGKVNLGCFIYNPGLVEKYIPDNSFYHFREGFIPELFERDERIFAFETDTYWNDIGSPKSYLRAWMDAFDGSGTPRMTKTANKKVEESSQRLGIAAKSKNIQIKYPVYVEKDVEIGEGAAIGPNAALCAGSRVGAGAVVADTLVMPNAAVSESAVINKAIVFQNEVIPA